MTHRWLPAAAVLGGPAGVGLARLAGRDLPWSVALLAGLAAAALVMLGLRLPVEDPVVPAPAARPVPPASTSFGDLAGLRFLVESDSGDPHRFETRLRPRLVAVATERLWQHHGIDWRSPAGRVAAEPVLGPGVTALLTAPPGALRSTPATLTSWLRELEAL